MPPARASLASVAKRWAPAISPIELGRRSAARSRARRAAAARPGRRARRSRPRARRWSASSSRRWRSSSRAIRTRVVCSARARRRAIRGAHFFENNAQPGKRQLGPEVVQVPEQVVVERDAHPDQPLAVIDQQPDVELDAGQLRRPAARSRPSRSAARATASASMRSDLPRSRPRAALAGHQPRRDADDALAADEQEPLERARDVPAVLQRPDPLAAQAARPVAAPRRTRGRRPRPSCSPSSSPVAAATAAIVCERLCMSAPSTIMPRPLSPRLKWTPGGHGLLGALPRSYQVTPGHPRPATSDTAKASQAPRPTA